MSKGATPLRAVRVEPELWEAARTKAAQQGDNLSAIIREALRNYAESCNQLMNRDKEIESLAEKLRDAGSGRMEPDYFREMALEILEAAARFRSRDD